MPLGILGGFLAFKWPVVGVVLLGAFNGYILSIIFILIGLGTVLYSAPGFAAFNVILTIIGAGLVFPQEHQCKVIGSAALGSFSIMSGIDIFTYTGFVDVIVYAMNGHTYYPSQIPSASWGLLAASVVLMIFGYVIQTMSDPPKAKKPGPSKPAWKYWPWQKVTDNPGKILEEPERWI